MWPGWRSLRALGACLRACVLVSLSFGVMEAEKSGDPWVGSLSGASKAHRNTIPLNTGGGGKSWQRRLCQDIVLLPWFLRDDALGGKSVHFGV